MKEQLLKKIENKEIEVGVVGLGYVGLPLAVEKAKAGFKTIGFDVQEEKVNLVNEGHNYIGDVVDSDLKKLVDEGMLKATTDFSFVKDVDFIAICVPTPLDSHQEPDISYVKASTEAISKYLTKGTMVVLESTTYPGTTEELIKPILEEGSGLKCGEEWESACGKLLMLLRQNHMVSRHSIQVRDLADTVSRLIHITLHGKQESMDSIHL